MSVGLGRARLPKHEVMTQDMNNIDNGRVGVIIRPTRFAKKRAPSGRTGLLERQSPARGCFSTPSSSLTHSGRALRFDSALFKLRPVLSAGR